MLRVFVIDNNVVSDQQFDNQTKLFDRAATRYIKQKMPQILRVLTEDQLNKAFVIIDCVVMMH